MRRLAAAGPDPAGQAELGDVAGRLAAAVALLPAEQREVVVMRVREELSFKEIAKVQGVSINTALARMQYALSKLRRSLASDRRAGGGDNEL